MRLRQLLFLGVIAVLVFSLKIEIPDLATQISVCKSAVCFQNIANNLLKGRSAQTALAELSQEPSDRCHTLAHFIGQELYRRAGSAPEAFNSCDGTCYGGCYHGVVEGYLSGGGSLDNLTQACSGIVDPSSGLYQDCLHGLGHGVMALTGDNLPQSLAVCDKFSQPDYCYMGVFMENSSSPTNPDHPSQFLKASDPLYPCDSLAEKYLPTCYTEQSNYFYQLSQGDWSKTIGLCLTVPTPYRAGCISYVGGNVVYFGQAAKLGAICGLIKDQLLNETCFQGAQQAESSARRF